MIKIIIYILAAILVFIMITWAYSTSTLKTRNCNNMNTLYKDFPKLHNVNVSNDNYKHNLRDYYIKTAYNACSAGKYKNDYVDLCALKNCIKQGARCLDFEVYSVNNKPVISTSSVDDYTIKETYNSVPFADMLTTINRFAFSGSNCPNPNDPLLIHLRIMSNNKDIYTEMAKEIERIISYRTLGSKYSYESNGQNFGATKLSDLLGKIVIIVDKANPLFQDTELDEYVNIASNSIFMRAIRYSYGLKYAPDISEITEFNKKYMTICLPDLSANDNNPSAALAMKCGCQMTAMCMQNFDANMEYYDRYFNDVGTAFVLKPEPLRFVPTLIKAPTPAPKEYSYKERNTKTDYYSLTI